MLKTGPMKQAWPNSPMVRARPRQNQAWSGGIHRIQVVEKEGGYSCKLYLRCSIQLGLKCSSHMETVFILDFITKGLVDFPHFLNFT